MKFFKMLKGEDKFPSKEIVVEVVALERQLPEFEEKLQDAEEEAVRLRQAKISGEPISDKDLEKADRDFESARLDLKAATATLEKLNAKLKTTVEKEREEIAKNLDAEKERIKEKKAEAKVTLAKAAARVRALQIYGSVYNENAPSCGSNDLELRVSFYAATPEHTAYIEEDKQQLAEVQETESPLRNLQRELDHEIQALEKDIDEIIVDMLRKAGKTDLSE